MINLPNKIKKNIIDELKQGETTLQDLFRIKKTAFRSRLKSGGSDKAKPTNCIRFTLKMNKRLNLALKSSK